VSRGKERIMVECQRRRHASKAAPVSNAISHALHCLSTTYAASGIGASIAMWDIPCVVVAKAQVC